MAATAAAYSPWRLAPRPPDASGTLAFLRTPRDSKLAVGRDVMLERCDDCRPVRGTRLSAAADYPFGHSTCVIPADDRASAWLAGLAVCSAKVPPKRPYFNELSSSGWQRPSCLPGSRPTTTPSARIQGRWIWMWPFQNGSYGSQDPATASLPCKIPCLAFVLAFPGHGVALRKCLRSGCEFESSDPAGATRTLQSAPLSLLTCETYVAASQTISSDYLAAHTEQAH